MTGSLLQRDEQVRQHAETLQASASSHFHVQQFPQRPPQGQAAGDPPQTAWGWINPPGELTQHNSVGRQIQLCSPNMDAL